MTIESLPTYDARAICSRLVQKSEFHAQLRHEDRMLNQGAFAQHNPLTDETHWFIRDYLVGLSLGRPGASRAYFLPVTSQKVQHDH